MVHSFCGMIILYLWLVIVPVIFIILWFVLRLNGSNYRTFTNQRNTRDKLKIINFLPQIVLNNTNSKFNSSNVCIHSIIFVLLFQM